MCPDFFNSIAYYGSVLARMSSVQIAVGKRCGLWFPLLGPSCNNLNLGEVRFLYGGDSKRGERKLHGHLFWRTGT